MKNSIVITTLAALILAACTSTPKSYLVEGVVPDESYNGKMVYMHDYDTGERIDSALVTNGKFKFTGSVESAMICSLRLDQLRAFVILENVKISVDISVLGSANGTPLNDELSKYMTEIMTSQKELQEKFAEIADLDDEIRKKQYDEIWSQYRAKIEPLRVKFFNANTNNVLGAFVLLDWSSSLDPDKLDELYSQAGEVVRNFKQLQKTIETNAKARQTAAGRRAPHKMTYTSLHSLNPCFS